EALGRSVKRHAEAVHEIDDLGPPHAHFVHRGLVLEEIAAVDGVVEVEPLVVARLPRLVIDAVNAALGADAVGALHGLKAHNVDVDAQLGQLHGGREACQSAANYHHAL